MREMDGAALASDAERDLEGALAGPGQARG